MLKSQHQLRRRPNRNYYRKLIPMLLRELVPVDFCGDAESESRRVGEMLLVRHRLEGRGTAGVSAWAAGSSNYRARD